MNEPASVPPPAETSVAPDNAPDTARNLEHLRMLSIFHYALAAITSLFALFPVIHLVIGAALVSGRMEANNPEDRLVGWFFVVIAVCMILGGLALAGFVAYTGRCLAQRRRHMLCLVVAGIECAFMPFGTVLGVFSLIVLTKPQVKALFANA